MASEAQRLIGISLTKIAQSRTHRGGVSLHKNLLIATVLQKARYIFMEEAYNMVHYQQRAVAPMQQMQHHPHHQQQQQQVQVQLQPQSQNLNMPQRHQEPQEEGDDLIGLTVEEAGLDQVAPEVNSCTALHDYPHPQSGCQKCQVNQQQNKENQPPGYHPEQLTYLDLDKSSNVLKERGSSGNTTSTSTAPTNLKRRRAASEWETEEAVQSILPKRRCSSVEPECTSIEDDDVFLDNATQLSESVSKSLEDQQVSQNIHSGSTGSSTSPMDSIDRITSLVSIFSFGMTSPTSADSNATSGNGKLTDLCSSQAKEGDAIQQRPFLAMTV